MSNLVGVTLNSRYEIMSVIARGGMATVYKARDLRLARDVAIKVIHPHLADDPEFRDKFFREARMIAKVSHSNLVNIFDQGDDRGNAFIVLELVQGITLREALKDFGALDPEQIVQVSRAMLSALAQAHTNGVVHRDLKPENILLADDGRIKVTDFGLARELTANTDTGSLVGTVAYLAPEVIRRGKSNAASDIYSFGIMLYEMLTGSQPFIGEDAMQIAYLHTNSRVPSAEESNSRVNSELNKLMLWCTEPLAENRPRDASQALLALEKLLRDESANENLPATNNLAETLILPSGSNSTEVIPQLETDFTNVKPFAKHHSRFAGTRWLVASVLAISMGSFGGWFFGLGPGAFVEIPNLSDKTQSQASKALSLVTENTVVKKIFSNTFASGQVVGTEPGAGVLVPKGTQIVLLVSKGKELVSVPEIIGADLITASAKLIGSRLQVGNVTEWFNSDYPLGVVYDHSGKDGTKLPVSSSINLKVSLGAIPVVSGLQLNVAKAALEAAGLTVRKIDYQYSNSVLEDEIISVVPDELEIGKGSSIKMIVSLGPETVSMPEVKGETILAAKSLLESLGLQVVIDTKWLSKDYGIKRVTGSSENAGSTIRVGQSVTIRSR